MKRIFVYSTLLITASAVAVACGGSDSGDAAKSTSPDSGTGKGTGGAAATSTGGGTSTSTGGASTASAGGAAAADCVTTTCEGKKVYGIPLASCCIDSVTCGVKTPAQFGGGCSPLSAIANLPSEAPEGGPGFVLPEGGLFGPPETIVLDTSCPDTQSMGQAAKGCCDKSGVCGVAITQLNQCFTIGDLGKLTGGMIMFDAGPQKPCTYKAP